MDKLKILNKLETLVNLRNRMYDIQLANEVDEMLFNREMITQNLNPQQLDILKRGLQKVQIQIDTQKRIVDVVDGLIEKELKLKSKN